MRTKERPSKFSPKAEADPTGLISRHTMNKDSDIHRTQHARAAVGCLIAGLCEDTQIYVSGEQKAKDHLAVVAYVSSTNASLVNSDHFRFLAYRQNPVIRTFSSFATLFA